MLEFTWPSWAFQIVNFLVLLGLSYLFLFRPLRSKLAQRSRDIADALQNARDQELEATRLRNEWESRMANVREEADAIIAAAEREAAERRAELLEEARQRLDRITADMRADLKRQRDEIVALNYDGMLDAIIDLSGNVIQSVTTRRTHDDLVQNFSASIYRLPQDEVESYRRSMAGRHPVAVVTTPVALSADQAKTVSDTLSSLIDRQVELQVRIVPELVAGMQVRLADRLIDNSVRQQLNRIREQVRRDLVTRLGANN